MGSQRSPNVNHVEIVFSGPVPGPGPGPLPGAGQVKVKVKVPVIVTPTEGCKICPLHLTPLRVR